MAMPWAKAKGTEDKMTAGKTKVIAAAGLAVLAVIWILQNGGSVPTKFLFVTVTMPQSALLAITLLVGVAAGILLALGLSGRWNKNNK
jgi:lipopolysaccharide assembly protein A